MDKELILEIIAYIEDMEEVIDWEFGACRNFNEILKDDDVPDIYFKLKELLKEVQ